MFGFTYIADDFWTPGWMALERAIAFPVIAWRSPGLTLIMRTVTFFGSTWWLVLFSALVVFGSRAWLSRRDRLLFLGLTLCTSAVCQFLKFWLCRPRPSGDFEPLVHERYFSLPSGHSTDSFCIYIFLAYLVASGLQDRLSKVLIMAAAGLLVLSIGLSRIYLAAHYPGDVVGGYAVAWVCMAVAIALRRQLYK